ncbi:clustered mitochondria-domain-containing protein [Zychaea mexicana]|uniref:clustered mitochondria-domain-containing protein n=1 Tax=Zychaea mexicana TaxID=64656 RepID=UPI0022FE4F5C|nr:clustered mitochondria-domain-containing protein [Zychaea mexicana]KAI9497198.1 clustered mitochondria-domain-containing protein [Zychaea mexicana]
MIIIIVVAEETFQLTIKLPGGKGSDIKIIASPREAIHDIKQSVMESPETCVHSCFYLALNGKRLNDFAELGEIEGMTPETELQLVEDTYTERDARLHINRLRDLLGGPYKPNPSAVGIDSGVSFLTAVTGEVDEEIVPENEKKVEDLFSNEPIPEHAFTDADMNATSKLSEFVPPTFQRLAPQCLKSLSLSGWNPVPHARRLKGDLLYLVVVTLENETLNITASSQGFFINNSTSNKFDASRKSGGKKMGAHSLIRLLQQASPKFASNFSALQEFITRHHMLEVLPVNTYFPAHPWAVQAPEHVFDPARPAEPLLNFGSDAVESLRDWNDELQSHRELPKANLQERVLRERLVNKVQSEFTEAAVRGAVAVVNGSVVPLNPMEPEESHMYVYNNIFFSKGNDGRGTFEALGADEAAHVATGKDLEGVKVFNSIDASGLYTLGSVIVDYKGVRVVAQSIVPGIFRRQDENSIVYGSVDNGAQISADDKFHDTIGNEVAKSLHLSEHALLDSNDEKVKLYTSLETKGLLGADGRRYLLDLYRLNPVDIEFQENECIDKDDKPAYPHKMTLLRPELMGLYWEHRFREWVKVKTEEIKKEKKLANGSADDKDKEEEQKEKPKASEEETPAAGEGEKKAEEEAQQEEEEEDVKIDVSEFKLSFNPDVFTSAKHGEDAETIKEQEQAVRDASKFLINDIIPSLVLDFASYAISPLDGDALTKAMHRRGINMRYLGKIAELVSISKDKRIEHIQQLAVQEMVVRSCKRMLRKLLNESPLEQITACVSHFLNCLFGREFNAKPKPEVPEGTTRNDFAWSRLTPNHVETELKQQVLRRFRYKLDDDFLNSLKVLPTLREICLRVGIQLEARDYRFTAYTEEERAAIAAEESAKARQKEQQQRQSSRGKRSAKNKSKEEEPVRTRRITTFVPDDIQNLMPTVKQATGRSVFAEETFEAGKMSLAQGHRQLGLELLLESLTLHEQTYGFLHPETSKCYATLAMIYHHGDDREAALDLQRKAVIAAERTNGVDHPETVHHYLNLGLFEHAAGRTKLALRYLKHALYYWDLVFGPGHPDSATADNNAGVMLQSLRDYPTSTKFFERACATQEEILGKEHVLTATGYHVLAKAYTLLGDFNKALNVERVAFGVFEKKLGAEDPRTKESDMWLKELTSNALLSAQRAREQAQSAVRPSGATAAAAAVPKGTAQQQQQQQPGDMPIEQVLQYINGDSPRTATSARKGKKKAQNKRR